MEKYFLKNFLEKRPIFGHIYTIVLVLISFIIFNANSLQYVIEFFKNLFGFNHLPIINYETTYYLKSYLLVIMISIIASTPIMKKISVFVKEKIKKVIIIDIIEIILCFGLLIITTAFLIDSSFNPFLYFRF